MRLRLKFFAAVVPSLTTSRHFNPTVLIGADPSPSPKQQLGNDKLSLLETKQNIYISSGGGGGRLVLSQQVTF